MVIAFASVAVASVTVPVLEMFVAVDADVADVAVEALPDNVAVIVPALKFPEASRATMVDAVFALVALDVTVNVELPDWLAVKVAEPERPVPAVVSVNVPSFATLGLTQVGAEVPFDCSTWPDVPAAENDVAPELV